MGGKWRNELQVEGQKRLHQRKKTTKRAYASERGCRNCPEIDAVVLHFHHPDPEQKHPKIKKYGARGWWMLSWKELFAEMEMCVVLCANCHLREEARLRAEGY